MRRWVVAPVALMMLAPVVAAAAGRPAAETCVNAGYRMGSTAFDMCVARIGGDDPLAALEGGELEGRAVPGRKPAEADPLSAIVPAKPAAPAMVPHLPAVPGEMPASFNAPTVVGAMPAPPVPAAPPAGPGGWWPTPPTAPTWPAVTPPTLPGWNFGSQ